METPSIYVVETKDGSNTLHSKEYDVTYHSIHGAIQESNHVFINAGLRYKAVLDTDINILEIGMGTGLNALLTFKEARKRGLKIDYYTVERYPIDNQTISQLSYLEEISAKEDEKVFFKTLHNSRWKENNRFNDWFSFYKESDKIEDFTTEKRFDVIYFDAFAPSAQPELWTDAVFSKMYEYLKPNGVLVTYCAQGAFKRTLKSIGYEVEKLKGPPGKREMTRGLKL